MNQPGFIRRYDLEQYDVYVDGVYENHHYNSVEKWKIVYFSNHQYNWKVEREREREKKKCDRWNMDETKQTGKNENRQIIRLKRVRERERGKNEREGGENERNHTTFGSK